MGSGTSQVPAGVLDSPLVSVCVVTYNHARFIRDCLDGILAQDASFPFEVLVGDDASTDGTAEIVREYAKRYPQKVTAILHKTNQGPTKNFFSVHNAARAPYVAHIDGDDLAYPARLRRQVELLEAHPECTVAAHDMDVISEDGVRLPGSYFPGNPPVANLEFLVRSGGYFCHSSKMYRRSAVLSTASDRELLDFYFHVEHARAGNIAWIPDRLGAYRRRSGVTFNPKFDSIIAIAHHEAIDHALELGCDPKVVRIGHLRVNMKIAHKQLLRGQHDAFAQTIRLRGTDYLHASWKHVVLSLLRNNRPALEFIMRKRSRGL
ncbi:MAG: glycosyltransferase [Candidatus Thermoplasmatota archaeon]|jgi:glycosyltransferase involved in cell wall biosynthesis